MKQTKKKSRLRMVILLLAALNALLLAAVALLFTRYHSPEAVRRRELIEMIGPEARDMSPEQLDDARLELLSGQLVQVRYNPEAQLSDGGINIYLSNSEKNGFSISAELKTLPDGKVIASTGLIDPGYRLEMLKCEARLAAGEHHCLLLLRAFSPDGVYLGEVGRSLMLTVK